MPHAIIYNPQTKTIESTVSGNVTLDVLQQVFTEQARLSAEHNCDLMLNDYRSAKIKLSTVDIYELPQIISNIAAVYGKDARQTKRALVITQDAEDYYFYETVVDNRSQVEKVFFDMEQAKAWLYTA